MERPERAIRIIGPIPPAEETGSRFVQALARLGVLEAIMKEVEPEAYFDTEDGAGGVEVLSCDTLT